MTAIGVNRSRAQDVFERVEYKRQRRAKLVGGVRKETVLVRSTSANASASEAHVRQSRCDLTDQQLDKANIGIVDRMICI